MLAFAAAMAQQGPDWTDKTSAVATGVAALAALLSVALVLAGAFIAREQLKEMQLSRHAQLMADYLSRWNDEPMVEARRKVVGYGNPEKLRRAVKRLYEKNHADYYKIIRVPAFFEDLATLEGAGSLSTELLSKHFGDVIIHEFDQWKPAIEYLRDRGGGGLDGFERLADDELARRGLPELTLDEAATTTTTPGLSSLAPWTRRSDLIG